MIRQGHEHPHGNDTKQRTKHDTDNEERPINQRCPRAGNRRQARRQQSAEHPRQQRTTTPSNRPTTTADNEPAATGRTAENVARQARQDADKQEGPQKRGRHAETARTDARTKSSDRPTLRPTSTATDRQTKQESGRPLNHDNEQRSGKGTSIDRQ